MKTNIIYNEDCLKGMVILPDKSINLIIADPPYNIGKAEWDRIPDYINWSGRWMLECQRVLKDNGSFYWFHNNMLTISRLMVWLENNTDFVFKQFIIWNKKFDGVKNEGYLQGYNEVEGLRNYQRMAEYLLFYTFQDATGLEQILVKDNFLKLSEKIRNYVEKNFTRKYVNGLFLKEGRYTSQLSAKVHASYKMGWNGGKRFDLMDEKLFNYLHVYLRFPFTYENLCKEYKNLRLKYEDLRLKYEDLRYTFNNQKTHHSVWNYEIAEKNGHLTPKPISLIENILKYSSNKDDIVLIPFVGSGNDCIACRNLGRHFIGYETSKKYYQIAKQRLQAKKTLWN